MSSSTAQEVRKSNWDQYASSDMDDVVARDAAAASDGLKVWPEPRRLRLDVRLESYPAPCATNHLRRVLGMVSISLDRLPPITTCISFKSASGRVFQAFIQDRVGEYLPKEIRLGAQVTLYAGYVYLEVASRTPGLVINEFNVDSAAPANQDAQASGPPDAGCGCHVGDSHAAQDYEADPGTAIPSAAAGQVVAIETTGGCGRHIVLLHTRPGDRRVYTRYAQIGDVLDERGTPLRVGQAVGKGQIVGHVGARKLLHFEVRPVLGRATNWPDTAPADPATYSFD